MPGRSVPALRSRVWAGHRQCSGGRLTKSAGASAMTSFRAGARSCAGLGTARARSAPLGELGVGGLLASLCHLQHSPVPRRRACVRGASVSHPDAAATPAQQWSDTKRGGVREPLLGHHMPFWPKLLTQRLRGNTAPLSTIFARRASNPVRGHAKGDHQVRPNTARSPARRGHHKWPA